MTRRITGIINRIRCHTTDPVPSPTGTAEVTVLAIDDYLQRLAELVTIDDNAPSEIDGFPTKTPGARPPEATGVRVHNGNVVEPETDDTLDIPTDPDGWHVYGHLPALVGNDPCGDAAIRLRMNGNPRDETHAIRMRAVERAQVIADELTGLAADLARWDKIRQPLPADTPQCWVAKVINALPIDVKWIPGDRGVRTQFAGYLTIPFPANRLVCRWSYDFVQRWRRLPTRDEMLEYLRTGYVRVNETVEAKSGKSA